MKKNVLFLFVIVVLSPSLLSQDSNLVFHFIVKKNFLKSDYDLYVINNNLSLWQETSDLSQVEITPNYIPDENYERHLFYKDNNNDEILSSYTILGSNFYVKDSINIQTWNLLDGTEECLGYQCKKATTKFRGRDYDVLYTTDIPISNGPWKFSGLPGMILKVSTKSFGEDYRMECIGIDFHKKDLSKHYQKYLRKNKKKKFAYWCEFEINFKTYLKKHIKSVESEVESEGDGGFSLKLEVKNFLEIFDKEIQTEGLFLEF